jgi:DNA-binding FadR family transcriptional regulator
MRVASSGAFERRSAESIARAIELDIIGADLAVGAMIGSEADLMQRFNASRGVIREAVCLVESHMLAETRKGVGGGVVVAEPAPSVVEGIVSLYLARKKASEVELLEARLALEVMAMRTTVDQLDDRGVELLEAEMAHTLDPDEDLTKASQRFHNLIAQLSGNTVLQLFIPTMTALVEEMWDLPRGPMSARARSETWASVASAHNEIIAAMLAKDVEGAVALLERHLEHVTAALGRDDRRVQVKQY